MAQYNPNQMDPSSQQHIPPAPSDSERYLKEEAERAKNKLISDLKDLKIDEDMSDQQQIESELENPRVKKFMVSNPQKISGHIKYSIEGEDDEGKFEQSRRYREFFALRSALVQRWPGIYIPALPEKALNIPVIQKILFLLIINYRLKYQTTSLQRRDVACQRDS